MNEEKPNNEYKVIYTNHLFFEGCRLAFRKKELFNIDAMPIHIPFNKNANCWVVKRKQLTVKKAKELLKNSPIEIDVTDLQWYQQEQINHVFNL